MPRGRGGVELEEEHPGDGAVAERGCRVVVRYDGFLNRGDVFERGRTVAFTLGDREVIAGLEYGVEGMRVGGRRRLRVGSHLAYREAGVPGRVPPNAVLILDVSLLEVRRCVGGVELGGTKIVCAIGSGPDDVRAQAVIPTRAPAETLPHAVAFFTSHARTRIDAVGIACFGPVDVDPASPTFGRITTTPKPGWAHTDVAGAFRDTLGIPLAFDTDVNGAALAEARWGAGVGVDPLVYVTVGTGIGGGAVVNGRLVHGLAHPEMGHMRVPRDRARDAFAGVCPYHADCLDGLASGKAMQARWNVSPETLPDDHPGWDLEADYLALGLVAITAVLSPRRIILGGGVMQRSSLLPRIETRVRALLAGYLRAPDLVPPALGYRTGVLGAITLAQQLKKSTTAN